MTLRDQIAQQALTLPPEDRAFLAELLEASLSSDGFATPELAAEWVSEVKRRVVAYDRSETCAYDVQTVVQSIRMELEERRSGRHAGRPREFRFATDQRLPVADSSHR